MTHKTPLHRRGEDIRPRKMKKAARGDARLRPAADLIKLDSFGQGLNRASPRYKNVA